MYKMTLINESSCLKMADVIQFWEMQMSTHSTGKYKHELCNGRDYSKYNRERKRLMSNNEC